MCESSPPNHNRRDLDSLLQHESDSRVRPAHSSWQTILHIAATCTIHKQCSFSNILIFRWNFIPIIALQFSFPVRYDRGLVSTPSIGPCSYAVFHSITVDPCKLHLSVLGHPTLCQVLNLTVSFKWLNSMMTSCRILNCLLFQIRLTNLITYFFQLLKTYYFYFQF